MNWDARPEEPRSVTLADLIALIAGAAAALSLSWWPEGRAGGFAASLGAFWRWWLSSLPSRETFFSGSALALGLAVLVRQARFRRAPRPWESAVLPTCGWTLINGFADIASRPDPWSTTRLALAVVSAGLVGVVVLRRTLPPWVKSLATALLLAVAMYCVLLHALAMDLVLRSSTESSPAMGSWSFWAVFYLTSQMPMFLPQAVVAVVAARDLGRADCRRLWTEWAGLALLAATTASSIAHQFFHSYTMPTDARLRQAAVLPVAILLLGALAYGLVRVLGPAWGRVLDPPPRVTVP